MRGLRTVSLCLLAALVLSGCMRSAAPVAAIQPQSDLDSLAYGQAYVRSPVAYAAAPIVFFLDAHAFGLDHEYEFVAGKRRRTYALTDAGVARLVARRAEWTAFSTLVSRMIGVQPA